jgi:hypothetical protein
MSQNQYWLFSRSVVWVFQPSVVPSYRPTYIICKVSLTVPQTLTLLSLPVCHCCLLLLLLPLQTCTALRDLADHEQVWESVATACWKHLAAVERTSYRTYKVGSPWQTQELYLLLSWCATRHWSERLHGTRRTQSAACNSLCSSL